MYNIPYYKREKDNILKECYFTERQEKIFQEMTLGTPLKKIYKKLDCCSRTVDYDIKNIKEKIEKYRNKDEKNYFYVYIHIFPNNKKYVGVTENIIKRWGKDGIPYSSNIKMYEDIIKYGWKNITHEILIKTESEVEARHLESRLIELLDLTNDKNGYNKMI